MRRVKEDHLVFTSWKIIILRKDIGERAVISLTASDHINMMNFFYARRELVQTRAK